jgi:hypothetical protein
MPQETSFSDTDHDMTRLHRTCRVFWGTHGCRKLRGHTGLHQCVCHESPYHSIMTSEGLLYWSFYGEDVELAAVIAVVQSLHVPA